MTIITRTARSTDGVTSIEATIILFFFVGLLTYVYQQLYVVTATFAAEKVASQVATVISQRKLLFNNRSLTRYDFEQIRKFIPILNDQNKNPYDIYIEELSYHSRRYNVVNINSKVEVQCELNRRLSAYNFSIQTSFGKNNSVYRVVVCRKLTLSLLFSQDPFVVSGVSVFPGQHH